MSPSEAKNDKQGGGLGRVMAKYIDASLSWSDLAWIKEVSDMPIVLKGIQTAADAQKAADYGVEAILLSNHGGRSLDTTQPAMVTLLEMHKSCPVVFQRLEVYVDGGIKRGTDIVKALALGAKAVGLGRAPLFGLGAGGTAGVERVMEILKAEVETAMRLLGAEKVSELGVHNVNARVVERDIYDGAAGLESLHREYAVKSKL